MERKLIVTEDGSHSIEIPELHTNYHSIHGAVQESRHVFVEAGLKYFLSKNRPQKDICIFEMGFGTGLSALLTLELAAQQNLSVYYQSAELYPLKKKEYEGLNYCEVLHDHLEKEFLLLHDCAWEEDAVIQENFTLHKSKISFPDISLQHIFDIVFFDAFDPNIQPELWTRNVFKKLYDAMNENGVFVTYSSKSTVRSALISIGFSVEKIPGAKGKREMIRAIKY